MSIINLSQLVGLSDWAIIDCWLSCSYHNNLFSIPLLWTFTSSQEMNEDHSTPKKEKQERLSKHKENMQHTQAEEEAQLLAQQRIFYDRNCRAFKRKVMIKRHDVEQEQIREVRRTYIPTIIMQLNTCKNTKSAMSSSRIKIEVNVVIVCDSGVNRTNMVIRPKYFSQRTAVSP